jgi:hypothetical protein
MNQVVYAQKALWGGLNTGLLQCLNNPCTSTEYRIGAAYWIVGAVGVGPGATPLPTVTDQGYVAPKHENAVFPSIGVGPTLDGLITFTLTGNDYFPSSAYGFVDQVSHGALSLKLVIADKGQSPTDGFTEYDTSYRTPRWGDYTAAVYSGGKVYFATEYIQAPNCSDATYNLDASCGGTRSFNANWGSSLNSIVSV